MTITEAIELGERENRRSYPKRRLEAHLALRILIEAGKRVLTARKYKDPGYSVLLSGETEE